MPTTDAFPGDERADKVGATCNTSAVAMGEEGVAAVVVAVTVGREYKLELVSFAWNDAVSVAEGTPISSGLDLTSVWPVELFFAAPKQATEDTINNIPIVAGNTIRVIVLGRKINLVNNIVFT